MLIASASPANQTAIDPVSHEELAPGLSHLEAQDRFHLGAILSLKAIGSDAFQEIDDCGRLAGRICQGAK